MYYLIRNGQHKVCTQKPIVWGRLDYKLYEWHPELKCESPRHNWVQIDGTL